MKDKIIILITLVVLMMFGCNSNIYASYTLPIEYEEYSYSSEYEKYIGLYYATEWYNGPTYNAFTSSNSSLYNDIFSLNLTVKKSELDKWYSTSPAVNGGIVCYRGYSVTELEDIFEMSSTYKMKDTKEIFAKGNSTIILEKGTLEITDDSGNTLAKVPHYVICDREDVYLNAGAGGTLTRFNIIVYRSRTDSVNNIKSDLEKIITTYNNFKTDTNIGNVAGEELDVDGKDFWGAASSWFGDTKGSYELPEQVDSIIDTFSDMINVVGTTAIVIATIVLGIKYMIGTVDSKTSAKEGLITLLVACVFFFGWTAISNLLYGGDNLDFIFTSSNDVTYTSMVGRIFNTFTYIIQFVAIGVIIFIGIKYIFAGAEGRADLKGKSMYFIIGIILVFATTNVLSFISKIINEAI